MDEEKRLEFVARIRKEIEDFDNEEGISLDELNEYIISAHNLLVDINSVLINMKP